MEHEVAGGEHHAVGLAAGEYAFKGEWVSAAGVGPQSEERSVEVAQSVFGNVASAILADVEPGILPGGEWVPL